MPYRVYAAFPGKRFDRVTGDQADQEKGEKRHTQEGGNDEAEAGEDKTQHDYRARAVLLTVLGELKLLKCIDD